MADKTSTFTTRIFLNDQQAKSKLESLEKDIKRLRNEQEAAAKAGDWTKFEQVKKDLKQANKEMDAMKTSAQKVSHVLDNLKTSSIKEIRQTMGAINRELKSGAVARNSQEWKFLNEQLKRCKQELQNVNQESKTSKSLWSRFFSFLNTNWGAFTQILGAITGLSVTIRKCVKDFADMDQAMVNVQKYTGQTKEQVEEMNEDFKKMNTPEAVEGSMVLRAKLDMANPNMHFRDPIMYRIIHTPHHRTGTKWNAYPMYDFAHGQSDYFEGVTHSICTLEFVPHRPLYDQFIDYLQEKDQQHDYRPVQIEFNRLNLTYTIMSKRKMLTLVEEKKVSGWDDPRMPTISGMRRRGYSPEGIRKFIDSIGYTKFDALNDMALLEAASREDLNARAIRVSAVLNPVKLVITNYPENETEEMIAVNNPENENDGTHTITFSRTLWIERDDFMEEAPKKFFRLTPGKEVRLKNAYIIMCTGCKKNEEGEIEEIYAEYDPESKSGKDGASRKVKGTLHWLSTEYCKKAEVRIYDRLFNVENTAADEREFHELLNPDSLQIMKDCYVEPFAAERKPGEYLQFQRIGYFMADTESTPDNLIFNKTVGLKDSWAKINKQ